MSLGASQQSQTGKSGEKRSQNRLIKEGEEGWREREREKRSGSDLVNAAGLPEFQLVFADPERWLVH